LLRDFHGGADGRVWLTCTSTGQLLVIKFSKVTDDETRGRHEVQRWVDLGVPSVLGTLLNRQAILFPFAFHYRETATGIQIDNSLWGDELNPPVENFEQYHQEAANLDPQEVLERCIRLCADKLLIHDDIFWKHVAIFPVHRELIPCFIDLTRMRRGDSSASCMEAMIEAVRTNLNIDLRI
jgi:Family of unknown function (DUF5898)